MKPSSPLLPGTFNSRDIGGLPAYGGEVRHGRIIRSDAPVELGHRGRELVAALGLATAIDLREPSEREVDRVDLSGLGVELRVQPALGEHFEFRNEMTLEDVYRHLIESSGENLTAAARRLAAPGALPALVFCSAGKDRTGLSTSATKTFVPCRSSSRNVQANKPAIITAVNRTTPFSPAALSSSPTTTS